LIAAALALAAAVAGTPAGFASTGESLAALLEARRCEQAEGEQKVVVCRGALSLGLRPQRADSIRQILALQLASLERWDELIAVYQESARLHPADPLAQYRLGAALLFAAGRLDEAVTALRAAVLLRPDYGEAHGALGVALNALGRHAEAVAALEEAVRLDPTYLEGRPASREVLAAAREGRVWPQQPSTR
jgi:tetratricopeptide (TPR) repeat protein